MGNKDIYEHNKNTGQARSRGAAARRNGKKRSRAPQPLLASKLRVVRRARLRRPEPRPGGHDAREHLRRRVPAGVRMVAPAEARPRGAERRGRRVPRAAEVVVERARALPSSLGRCGWRGCRRRLFAKLLVGHARRARAGAGPRAVRLRRELPDVGRPRRIPTAGAELRERGLYSIAGVEPARLSCWWRRGRRCHVGIAVGVHFAPPGLLLARVVDGRGSSRRAV